MQWNNIQDKETVDNIVRASQDSPQLLFKHSTTCPISSMAKMRLEDHWNLDQVATHYLDLLAYRPVSNYIAESLDVHHESPQVILLVDGEVVFDASHLDISVEEVKSALDYAQGRSAS